MTSDPRFGGCPDGLTVAALRALLADLPDDTPVIVHVEVDFAITEWDRDPDDGLILFPDTSKAVG